MIDMGRTEIIWNIDQSLIQVETNWQSYSRQGSLIELVRIEFHIIPLIHSDRHKLNYSNKVS